MPEDRSRPRLAIATLAVTALLGAAACRPAAPPPGESWLPRLAAGTYLASGAWIDFRQRYGVDVELTSRLEPSRLAVVTGGWGGGESWGGWGLGERTELRFFLRWLGDVDFHLVCRSPALPGGRPQTVRVTINGREIAATEVGAGWERLRFEVPPGLLRRGDNSVELAYGSHLPGDAADDRPLALAIERVGLLPRGARLAAAGAAGGVEADVEGDVLQLRGAGTYLVPARLPAGAEALELTARIAGRGGRWRAGVMTLDGREETLLEGGTGRQRFELGKLAGREVFLLFDADLPPGGRLELTAPRLVAGAASAPGAAPSPPPAGRPNVVLAVLDAARPDHFGVYGYGRDTTPRIDRLARQSLVFTDAVAECPYTACSMPNLLTGLSFREHGVTGRGQRLAAEVETLAETLSGLGYQTLGFTGNPNSSRLTGSDQGFDELFETWHLASGRDRTHPEFLNARVGERLARGLDDERPLFLLLHYVPPHEPYDPDPRFDVFGDPGYAGPVTGEQGFLQSVFAGEVELDAADLAQLAALYDGNLLMADHAVGRLIELLRDAGRWDDTIFVLTSDHGEAFGEHGFLGHNDSLYEEMLRVPLILRLPGGERPAGVTADHLASLGDVVPTVLGRLGRPVPAAARGRDLLAPARQVDERLVFLRSAHEEGVVFGARTTRFKLMAREREGWGGGWVRLFDLAEDPGERRDVAAERRLLQAALGLRLERWLDAAGPAPGEPSAMSEEDLEMLRSLGYLG